MFTWNTTSAPPPPFVKTVMKILIKTFELCWSQYMDVKSGTKGMVYQTALFSVIFWNMDQLEQAVNGSEDHREPKRYHHYSLCKISQTSSKINKPTSSSSPMPTFPVLNPNYTGPAPHRTTGSLNILRSSTRINHQKSGKDSKMFSKSIDSLEFLTHSCSKRRINILNDNWNLASLCWRQPHAHPIRHLPLHLWNSPWVPYWPHRSRQNQTNCGRSSSSTIPSPPKNERKKHVQHVNYLSPCLSS